MNSMASSRLSTGTIGRTGPKISLCRIASVSQKGFIADKHVDVLAHQGIRSVNSSYDSRFDELFLLVRASTVYNFSFRVVKQRLDAIEVRYRDDARE